MVSVTKTSVAKQQDSDRDMLKAFYDRRHPAYLNLINHWDFLDLCYSGGRDWFEPNIFRYFKEGDIEFADRLKRAYRFNHTREVVELVQKYLFKAPVTRNTDRASDKVKKFWKTATLRSADIEQLMRTSSATCGIGGRSAIVVDNNFPEGVTLEDGTVRALNTAEAAGYRIYAYVVKAQDVLDYAWDEDGDGGLLWIKLREIFRDDADPLASTGDERYRVRLWTRTNWSLYEQTTITLSTGQVETVVKLIDTQNHTLGIVPVHLHDNTLTESAYKVPGLIDDIAYLDRAVANYMSNLDAIINDQTFSQLAIPAQAVQQGDDMYKKVQDMGTKRVFVYDGGSGSSAKPEYLSPDPKQAGVILSVVTKLITEIYHTIGLAGERTKEDNSAGIDNSSGVAKAYDFERINSLLLSKAASCQLAENWIVKMICLWSGEPVPEDDLVTYPTTFDVMRLADELATAEALAKIQAPIELRRQQMRATLDKMMPQLAEDVRTKILTNIGTWLEGSDVLMPPTVAGAAGGKFPTSDKSPAAPSRQGQVTKDTPPKAVAK